MSLNDELLQAAKNKDIEKVKSLLKEAKDINNVRDEQGRSLLYYVVLCNDVEMVEQLFKLGADPNNERYGCVTTFINPVINNNLLEIAKVFIKYGIDINLKDPYLQEMTALHWVICSNNRNMTLVSSSMAKVAGVNASNIDMIKFLIDEGANVNAKDKKGCTPLHCAARYQQDHSIIDVIKILQLLINKGADVNTKDNDERTPLSLAIKHELIETFLLLLLCGANLSEQDQEEINNDSKFKECLTTFKKIKEMPHLGKLIEVYRNRDTNTTLRYIGAGNSKNRETLIHEVQEIKGCCSPTIFKCLCDFIEHAIQEDLLKYRNISFKKEAFNALLSEITSKNTVLTNSVFDFKNSDPCNITLVCRNISLKASKYNDVYSAAKEENNIFLTKLRGIECASASTSQSR